MATAGLEHQPIRDWRDGCAVDQVVVVREVERRRKRDGDAFLRTSLGDRSGSVPAVLWADGEVRIGDPVRVAGRLSEHPRYGRQLTVENLAPAATDEIDWSALFDGPL